MEYTRERVFEDLLSALGSADPLKSLLIRSVSVCRGSGLVVNELGEVIRSVGSAPSHLVSEWVMSVVMRDDPEKAGVRATTIGRWEVWSRRVRIRHRDYAVAIAMREETEDGADSDTAEVRVELVLDTIAKLLQAFEGFEAFSISTRTEESARLMRDLEAGISPGREPALWRLLENFGFIPYEPVRLVRIRMSAQVTRGRVRSGQDGGRGTDRGIVVSDSGQSSLTAELTALCADGFPVEQHFDEDGVIGVGVSEPFTALSQVPEMLRTADVALAAAKAGQFVYVDEMRPVEWAAARMSSRFDRQIVQRFLERIRTSSEALVTVTTYIESGANIAESARRLQLHENSVRYRLGQVERVLGARLSDPRVCADIVIALECSRLNRQVPQSSPKLAIPGVI